MGKRYTSYFFALIALFCVAWFLTYTERNESEILKVGTIPWLGYEPLFLARHMGKYDPEKIKLVELQNTTETLHLLREGVLDAGTLTIDETLGELALGTDLEVILVLDVSNGADVVLGQSDIKTLSDLKGKKVGVENNAVGAFVLYGALATSGLKIEDIEVVPLTANKHVETFLNREVEGVVTYSPSKEQLIEQGALKLFDSSQIPNQIIDMLVIRKGLEPARRASILALISGYYDALDYLRVEPLKAAQMMSARIGMTAEEMLVSYQGVRLAGKQENRELLIGSPSQLQVIADSLQATLIEAGLLERKVDISQVFNAQYIEALE